MQNKNLLLYITFLFVLLLTIVDARAQTRRSYTANNYITVVLESPNGRYEFKSPSLLVRYNRLTDQLECSVLINSLLPTSDTIPTTMAYEVLYGVEILMPLCCYTSPEKSASVSTRHYILVQAELAR